MSFRDWKQNRLAAVPSTFPMSIFLLPLSCKFLPCLWTHVTSGSLTLRANITDQTSMFGVKANGETTGLLMLGLRTSSKYVYLGNRHVFCQSQTSVALHLIKTKDHRQLWSTLLFVFPRRKSLIHIVLANSRWWLLLSLPKSLKNVLGLKTATLCKP